jgi:DNA-directed RNA polymerase subunit beta'
LSTAVNINDKHFEVISRQMMRWVKVEEVGDSAFLIDEVVDRFRFMNENNRLSAEGKKAATGHPLLLGITEASLSTDSFISAASFQETTRVTEAAISGKVDHLPGLKDNVIRGRMIVVSRGHDRGETFPSAPQPAQDIALCPKEPPAWL